MNTYRTKLLSGMQLVAIVLMTLMVAVSAGAQSPASATSKAAAPQQSNSLRGITVPPVPGDFLRVDDGFEAFLVGHAVGTQNYVCRQTTTGVGYVLFTPEATLSSDNGKQIITHFFSPNPDEANTDPKVVADRLVRATWQDSQDTSTIWAKVHQPNGSVMVDKDSIAWLLLDVVGDQNGPTGDNTLAKAKFVQRLNTTGGLPPSTGCSSLSDVGNEAFVPYTADYFFYKKADIR